MNIIEIIEKKKLGYTLTKQEINYFINGIVDGSIPDYQTAALLMAIRINGMTREETVALTIAMTNSGETANLSDIPGVPSDKHSTGGVGDTTTLILVPLLSACGLFIAKMSGRGLGHTGGTLDKLESIDGLTVQLSIEDFIKQVKEIGCAVIGQTGNIAPADKILYALRDVTSTVDSLPLIASSIMSKKLASGAKCIVLDVKTGKGAIMQTIEESVRLAQVMVQIGSDAGRKVVAIVTNMDEPLGSNIGNALEVKEAIDVLSGKITGPLLDVAIDLGIELLILGKKANTKYDAKKLLLDALESGAGLNKLKELIIAQHGNPACITDTSKLPVAKVIMPVKATTEGYIRQMHTIALGNIAQNMGAGRKAKTDIIDPSVGIELTKRVGDAITLGETIAFVHAKDEESANIAINDIRNAIIIDSQQPHSSQLIYARVDAEHVLYYN